jgi:hypothetical protein
LIHGFISYAHTDYRAFEKIRVHLTTIERALPGKIEFWADARLHAGDYWTQAIRDAIQAAQVHLLLVTAEFLASNYIALHELPAINAKYAAGDLVIPVIVKGCIWQPFVGPLQAVPVARGRAQPICDWSPRDRGFYEATAQNFDAIHANFVTTAGPGLDWHR